MNKFVIHLMFSVVIPAAVCLLAWVITLNMVVAIAITLVFNFFAYPTHKDMERLASDRDLEM